MYRSNIFPIAQVKNEKHTVSGGSLTQSLPTSLTQAFWNTVPVIVFPFCQYLNFDRHCVLVPQQRHNDGCLGCRKLRAEPQLDPLKPLMVPFGSDRCSHTSHNMQTSDMLE